MSAPCGVNVCLGAVPCQKAWCRTPVGPTVDSASDMMASAVTARTVTGIFPTVEIGMRGIKLTRPGYFDIYRSGNYRAWTNGSLCCTL